MGKERGKVRERGQRKGGEIWGVVNREGGGAKRVGGAK